MSKVEVVMPQLGESLTEGTIVKWHKKPGDKVRKDETLLEISTDKVDSEIPSPVSGIVTKLLFEEQATVAVRTVIAEVDTDSSATVSASAPAPAAEAPKAAAAPKPEPKPAAPAPAPVAAAPAPAPAAAAAIPGRFYSPLVLNIAREEGISMAELETIPGTGEGGRVSKKDMLAYVANRAKGGAPAVAAAPVAASAPAAPAGAPKGIETTLKHIDSGDLAAKYPAPHYEILQMSNVLQKMAQHMIHSVQTSPHVQAIHECDMTNVDKVRRKNAEAFEKREGFKLTFMPFICDAVVKALKQYPLVNASIEGDKIIVKKSINLGIAVASENGLIVPVVKGADEKNLVGLGRGITDLASRTRSKRLTPADIDGGTFTITNFGVFGTMIGMPIIAQPQVAILGIGAAKKCPVVVNDAIAIRLISYLTLSFDHRIVDGALGGMFMDAVVKNLEGIDEKGTI